MSCKEASRPTVASFAALLGALAIILAAPPAAEAETEGAAKAAQRTIALGNFVVNRDVIGLRGGQTTSVFAGCPGRTRFFTSGFRPFLGERGVPRVNFVVTAIIPRPNGVTYRFHNPHPAATFPVNIRVSAMCLTLGTVSVGAAASERVAAAGNESAVTAKKKGKSRKKGKVKLKARTVVKKVKVGKKKKGKKKRKRARSSASARSAAVNINLRLFCDRPNEMPAQFGFEISSSSEFLGATPIQRGGDVGLQGNFMANPGDIFSLQCLRAEGPVNLGSQIGDGGGGPAGPSMVNHYFEQGPTSSVPIGGGLNQVNYTNSGIINGEFLTGIGQPPTPIGAGTWSGPNAFSGNGFNPATGEGIMFNPFDLPALFDRRALLTLLRLKGINEDKLTHFPNPVDDLFTPPQGPPTAPAPACSDGADNDMDGPIDLADPGCLSGVDVDEKDLTGTGPCPSSGTIPFSGSLVNAGSTMARHQLTINGLVEVDKLDFEPDFLTGSTVIMGVTCSSGTVVDVMVSWAVIGTTVTYDFSVAHVMGSGGDSFDKTIAADTR